MQPGIAVIDILVCDRPTPGQITCLVRVVINAHFTPGGDLGHFTFAATLKR